MSQNVPKPVRIDVDVKGAPEHVQSPVQHKIQQESSELLQKKTHLTTAEVDEALRRAEEKRQRLEKEREEKLLQSDSVGEQVLQTKRTSEQEHAKKLQDELTSKMSSADERHRAFMSSKSERAREAVDRAKEISEMSRHRRQSIEEEERKKIESRIEEASAKREKVLEEKVRPAKEDIEKVHRVVEGKKPTQT